MIEKVTKLYEGLFLMDQQNITGDLASALGYVREILDRANAEVLALRKWDDRRLAYVIKGQKRGTYILAVFNVDPSQIVSIERDCNLSDQVLRVMITRGDHMGEFEVQQEVKAAEKTDTELKLKETANDRAENLNQIKESEKSDSDDDDEFEQVIAGEEDNDDTEEI